MMRGSVLMVLAGFASGCLLPLERTNPLDVRNPDTEGAPPGFELFWSSGAVILDWDALELNDLEGYKLYRREGTSGELLWVDTVQVPPWSDELASSEGLNELAYALTALSTSGLESPQTEPIAMTSLVDPLDGPNIGDWGEGDESISFQGGDLVVSSSVGFFNSAVSSRRQWGDFWCEVDVKGATVEDGAGQAVMLLFRGQSKGFASGYVVSFFQSGRVILDRRTGGEWFNIMGADVGVNPFSRNTLGVRAEGSLITVYVNGSSVLQVQDTAYANGWVGLGAQDGMQASFKSSTLFTRN